MSIFKYLTLSHLQKVLAALETRFKGIESDIDNIENAFNDLPQSDWNENDSSNTTYILNKPSINSGDGIDSIVEGQGMIASGDHSHAEGLATAAVGDTSHAEGLATIAAASYQHVQGSYNVEDVNSVYAHIVGNGTSSARSNAHTLDWNGNGWYAGKLTVGVAPTANMDVATKKYVDDATAGIADEKLSTNTIGSGVYYPIVGTNTTSATTKYIDSTGLKYDATSSTNGYARLYLGNGTASGTEGSKYGRLMIYGTTVYAVTLDSGSPTENRTISLPNKNGTVALTSDVPTKVSDLTNDSGFITSYTETDPVFAASAAHGITSSDISNWNSKTSLELGTTSSTAYRGDYGNAAYTHAVTNKGSAFSNGLYKITTNSEGHVTAATSVEKFDITGLGIPAQDTTYTFDGTYNSSTNKAATVSTVTNAIGDLSLNLSGNTVQLKQGNTVLSSITLPIYNGGVSS